MAFLGYVPIGIDVIGRVYKLIAGIKADRQPSTSAELATLQHDVGLLKDALELQTQLFDQRERNLTDCVEVLERQVRGLMFQVWSIGLVLAATILYFGMR